MSGQIAKDAYYAYKKLLTLNQQLRDSRRIHMWSNMVLHEAIDNEYADVQEQKNLDWLVLNKLISIHHMSVRETNSVQITTWLVELL